MSSTANIRIRENCMICEGTGRDASAKACSYCGATGIVFARCGAESEDFLTPSQAQSIKGLSEGFVLSSQRQG